MNNAAISSDPVVVSSARWFWWIAGLSLVNVVLFYSGSDASFVVGLGITTIASIMLQTPTAAAIILAMLAFYFYVGYMAQRGQAWAFYIGLVVYVIDALIFVYFQDWLSVAFHALAIYFIAKGLARLREELRPPA